MSGSPKIKVFEYNLDGKYLRAYDSISEFRDKYFSHIRGKKPLFNKNELGIDYHLFKETILFKKELDVCKIKKIIEIDNSKDLKPSGRKPLYPEGKYSYHKLILNKDFANIQKEKVKEVMEPFYLIPGETESEYMKRIQEMNLEKSFNQCLKCRK